MGVQDPENSGIRGGWRLELSFFHGGAVRERAFKESELKWRKVGDVRLLGLCFALEHRPRENREDSIVSNLPHGC